MSAARWALALVLCLASAVTACGSSSTTLPVVAGGFGTDPLITLPGARPPGGLVVRTLSEGSGPVIRASDYVLFDVAAKVWTGDRLVLDTFTSHQPQGLPLSAGLPAWRHLAGQRVGSRVLEVVPPRDGFGRRGDASVNVTGTDTLVFVFDILAAVPSAGHASGTVVRGRPGAGLPQVTNSAHGPVVLVPPRAAPPGNLVTRVLIAWHGPRLVPARPWSPSSPGCCGAPGRCSTRPGGTATRSPSCWAPARSSRAGTGDWPASASAAGCCW